MLTQEDILRYDRQIKTEFVGAEGQIRLKNAKVLVVGAGGLGCPALQYLTAAGIGKIHILDGDRVSLSNLQRQPLFSTSDINKYKAETAAQKLTSLNPLIEITYQNEFLSATLALELFPNYDLIVDCSDNFGTRYLINDVCLLYNLTFVSAALYQTEGQLGTFNVFLENKKRSAGYSDFFPENTMSQVSLDCNEVGVVATLPGIMGLMQANEVLKYFINPSTCVTNQLLLLNATTLKTNFIKMDGSNTSHQLSKNNILTKTYHLPVCESFSNYIVDDVQLSRLSNNNYQLIDVREKDELPIVTQQNIINIPLSVFNDKMHELSQYKSIIFVCKSGVRSKQAYELVNEKYPHLQIHVYKKGIEDLLNFLNDVK